MGKKRNCDRRGYNVAIMRINIIIARYKKNKKTQRWKKTQIWKKSCNYNNRGLRKKQF